MEHKATSVCMPQDTAAHLLYLLGSVLYGSLEAPPLELASDQLVAAHDGIVCPVLPVRTQGTSVGLLRMELSWVPLHFVVL